MLSDQQIERYSRQIILPQVGGRGQETLLAASVAIIGRDDLGTVAATYLAAAGIGRLALSAAAPLAAIDGLNPDCRITALPTPLTRAVVDEVAGYDAVLICGAVSGTWQMLAAGCVAQHTPLLWGEAAGSRGLVAAVPGHCAEPPCAACVRAQATQLLSGGDAGNGLADVTAAFVGTLLATAALKMLIRAEAAPAASLLTYDASAAVIHNVALSKTPHCPACGASDA